jgi:hypothetical protein
LKQDQETQALFITQNEERMKILEEDLRKAKEKNLPEEIKEEVEFLKSKLKELVSIIIWFNLFYFPFLLM